MWLELASIDIPASAKFYGDLFDWPIVKDQQMGYTMTAFEGDETAVGFAPVDEAQGTLPGSVLVYVDVAGVDATIARARELGGPGPFGQDRDPHCRLDGRPWRPRPQ